MISLEKNSNNKKYVIYLPDNNSNMVEVNYRIDNGEKFDIKNNMVLVELSREMDERDILNTIKSSLNEIIRRGYRVNEKMHFIVNSVDDERKVNNVIGMGFTDTIENIKSDKYYNDIFKSYLALKTIQKMDNGRIVNYVIAYGDNNSNFLLAGIDGNKMEQAFYEMINSDRAELFNGKKPYEISNMVLNYIADRDNLKRYMLSENDNKKEDSRIGNVVKNVATPDDLINTELGIIKNDVKDKESKSYQTVSVDGDEVSVAEVNPGTVNINSSYNDSVQDENPLHVDEQNMEEISNYYMDDLGNLYDKDENMIGNMSDNEYRIDTNDNSLYYNGRKVGVIDDYRMLGVSQEKKQEHTLKRVLVPNDKNNFDNQGIIRITIMGVILAIFIMTVLYLIVR